jgi:hypothetical protein
MTRILAGDIFLSGEAGVTSIDLKIGPVGIVVPLRGMLRSLFVFFKIDHRSD